LDKHVTARRVLYHPDHVARLRSVLAEAKSDLHEMHERHVAELNALRGELDELREILAIVVDAARSQAESNVATLRRQLEYALARLERPNKSLH
jgi:hypothetical protein